MGNFRRIAVFAVIAVLSAAVATESQQDQSDSLFRDKAASIWAQLIAERRAPGDYAALKPLMRNLSPAESKYVRLQNDQVAFRFDPLSADLMTFACFVTHQVPKPEEAPQATRSDAVSVLRMLRPSVRDWDIFSMNPGNKTTFSFREMHGAYRSAAGGSLQIEPGTGHIVLAQFGPVLDYETHQRTVILDEQSAKQKALEYYARFRPLQSGLIVSFEKYIGLPAKGSESLWAYSRSPEEVRDPKIAIPMYVLAMGTEKAATQEIILDARTGELFCINPLASLSAQSRPALLSPGLSARLLNGRTIELSDYTEQLTKPEGKAVIVELGKAYVNAIADIEQRLLWLPSGNGWYRCQFDAGSLSAVELAVKAQAIPIQAKQ